MHYLHDGAPQRIVHRDLKSPNILVTADHTLKICDFGASRAVGPETIKLASMVGTIAWMAPEVIRQDAVINEKCDVWSFGVVRCSSGRLCGWEREANNCPSDSTLVCMSRFAGNS